MSWIRWLLNREDAITRAYQNGLSDGMDIMERAFLLDDFRKAEANYPDDEHGNVISICRHRSWIPRGGAA